MLRTHLEYPKPLLPGAGLRYGRAANEMAAFMTPRSLSAGEVIKAFSNFLHVHDNDFQGSLKKQSWVVLLSLRVIRPNSGMQFQQLGSQLNSAPANYSFEILPHLTWPCLGVCWPLQVLFRPGNAPDELYVIHSGSVLCHIEHTLMSPASCRHVATAADSNTDGANRDHLVNTQHQR